MIEGSNLKPKIILDCSASQIQFSDQPVRSNFQIINRTHNAYFLKKVIFGEKIDYLLKKDYFGENPKLSKLIQLQWNEMQSDMSMGIYDEWSYHNSASVNI